MGENKGKEKSKFKQIERNIFIRMTRNRATKEYNEELEKLRSEYGTEIDYKVRKSLRRNIVNKNARKLKVKVMGAAIATLFAGSVAIGTGYALNEGSGRTEGVTQEEASTDTISRGQAFRDKYRVESLDEMINKFDLEDDITREVEVLKDKEAVLNYVKEQFVDEYNKMNEEAITADAVTLYRTHDNQVYSDTALNGERIIRICSEEYAKENNLKIFPSTGEVIKISVNNKVVEMAVGVSDHFELGYLQDEEISNPREAISEKLGNLLNAGIAYSATLSEENAKPNQSSYRKKLIDEMIKYKESQTEQTIDGRNNNQVTNNNFEIGE